MDKTTLSAAIEADIARIGKGEMFMSRARAHQGKNPSVVPLDPDRAMYEYLRSVYPSEVIVTDGFLCSVVAIPNAAWSSITFVLTKNDNTASDISLNNLLDQSDTFESLYFSLGFYSLATSAPGSNVLATGVTHSQAEIQWTANKFVFSDTLEAANMNALYNGYLKVTVGSTVYFEQFPCAKFKMVSVSQQGVAVSTTATIGVLPESSQHFDETKRSIIPTLMVNGSGKNIFEVFFNDPSNMSPTTSNRTNYAIFKIYGYKCQDGAEQATKKFHFSRK